jgi:hypothetical protein
MILCMRFWGLPKLNQLLFLGRYADNFRNETATHLNSSLKFPDLTEAKDLDTLEYSLNKEDLDFSKHEKENIEILTRKYDTKDGELAKYLIKSPEEEEPSFHNQKEQNSLFTLSKSNPQKSYLPYQATISSLIPTLLPSNSPHHSNSKKSSPEVSFPHPLPSVRSK